MIAGTIRLLFPSGPRAGTNGVPHMLALAKLSAFACLLASGSIVTPAYAGDNC